MDYQTELDKLMKRTFTEFDGRASVPETQDRLAGYSDRELVEHCYAGARTDEAFAEFEFRHCANLRQLVKYQFAQLEVLLHLRVEINELLKCLKPEDR